MSACLLICHQRPEKTKVALQPLADFSGPLYLFCDGPNKAPEKTQEVRAILVEAKEQRDARGLETCLFFPEKNFGCGRGPQAAIQWLFAHEYSGHIIEDDILVHPAFFTIHQAALEKYQGGQFLWIAEGHPLPDCPAALLETQMCRLVAWSTWRENAQAALAAAYKMSEGGEPTPWKRMGWKLLRGLHPKTQVFLAKEFGRLERKPNWSWHYQWLQWQLESEQRGLTPTARLHENLGLDGSGHNCQNVFGVKETWEENEIKAILTKKLTHRRDKSQERKMETTRYGRILQSIGRKLLKITPQRWKWIWRPV